MDVSLSELCELVMDREAWRAGIHGVAKSHGDTTKWLNWTELNRTEPVPPASPALAGGSFTIEAVAKEIAFLYNLETSMQIVALIWEFQFSTIFGDGSLH